MPSPTALDLLWGTRDRPRRGPKPSLTLERIVGEAIALADAEGLANLSMQRLAERLGCAKMALYRYLPGKSELTALMLDFGMGAAPGLVDSEVVVAEDVPAEPPWRRQLRDWTVAVHRGMLTHPWMHELVVGVRPLGPNEIGWFEAGLTPLAETGLSGPERLDAIALLAGHARALAQQAAGGPGLESEMARQLAATLSARADRYPHTLAAFAEPGGPGARDNALNFGIDRILDGLAALMATRAGD
nr:TetR/AcrR family transcriptional regulator [Nocardia sp. BMG111209]